MKKEKGEMCSRAKSRMVISPFSFNPALRSFPPYSLTLIKLRKSHLGNSSKLKRVFFLVARQRLSKLIFTLTPASVDCTRFGVGSPFSFNPALRSFPPSHLGNSSKLDCTRFGVGSPFSFLLSFYAQIPYLRHRLPGVSRRGDACRQPLALPQQVPRLPQFNTAWRCG